MLRWRKPRKKNRSMATTTLSESNMSSSSTSAAATAAAATAALHLTPEAAASLPPPGLSGPSQIVFAPQSSRYVAFVSVHSITTRTRAPVTSPYRPLTPNTQQQQQQQQQTLNANALTTTTSSERVLLCLDLQSSPLMPVPLLRWSQSSAVGASAQQQSQQQQQQQQQRRFLTSTSLDNGSESSSSSLEERLRRERQRLSTTSTATITATAAAAALAGSLTQFSWKWIQQQEMNNNNNNNNSNIHSNRMLRLLIPARGNLFVQDGILEQNNGNNMMSVARCVHDKNATGVAALDAQLSPDGTMIAWTAEGDIHVQSASAMMLTHHHNAIRITADAVQNDHVHITHGVADFVAQEEMDRYQGFWWHPDSNAILFTRTDESNVPLFRILHQEEDYTSTSSNRMYDSSAGGGGVGGGCGGATYEDHRYPFAGKENPLIRLGLVKIDRESIMLQQQYHGSDSDEDSVRLALAQDIAAENWQTCTWFDAPREASEYLARVHWLPDGTAVAQWQNRKQTVSVLYRLDPARGKGRTLLIERSEVWINLHHMFRVLNAPIHPDDCYGNIEKNIPPIPKPLPVGSFSFLYASERSGFSHLYLYTYVPGINGEQAILIKALSAGEWMVESIVGVDQERDIVYVTGTYDSVLERHLYALPIVNMHLANLDDSVHASYSEDSNKHDNGVRRGLSKVMDAMIGKTGRLRTNETTSYTSNPVRMTVESGMHSVVMDDNCRYFVDTSSDLDRPTSVKIYEVSNEKLFSIANGGSSNRAPVRLKMVLYDAVSDDKAIARLKQSGEKVFLGLPPPELISLPTSDGAETLHAALYRPDPSVHGPGPYPLVCAVYGGPHVQRVNRSWSLCADMRAQRLRSLGFCVVKCDNRGSSRRGLAFESAIARRFGRLEVLDQVAVVRQLTVRGIADPTRVGIYGWSYGGYLSAMCLCRAPDVFHVAVAGAPVTSWDGYDTHYTERYMGLPVDNPSGYRESAVFEHIPNMRGKLMIVHGLIDENVHFRHTTRLINKLIAAGKDYDLLIFPEERHSPRRLRDRIYMEKRISEYFVKHLGVHTTSALDVAVRTMAGHL